MATLAELIVRVGADATEFEKHMNKIERTLNKTSRTLTDVGGKLTTGLTLPLAAAGGGALKASIDFESAFAGVRKTVDASEEELEALSEGIRQMAKEIPQSATAIAGIAEAAGQLGIQTEHILTFTRTMADLGVATNLSGEEAATALARLANITQMPQSEFDRLGSTIVALGNNLATTEAEIVEMGLRIAGAGSQVGMTEAQILAFAGALSSVGIAAEAGGSAISRVMINIANEVASGGEKLELLARVAGMSADEFAEAWRTDAAGALVTFIEGLGRLSAEGENVFAVLDELGMSEIRVRDALLRAAGAGDLFRNSLTLATQAWEENTALANEAAQRYGTTESQLTILKNQLVDMAITLGDALAPALSAAMTAAQPFIDTLARIAEWFANLDPEAQRLIINIGLVAAAIGPLLVVMGKVVSTASGIVHIFGSVGTTMLSLVGTGGKLMEAFALWRGGAGTFVEAMGLVISPIGAVM
ncbi:phage tail tape measure protein, partial [Symbiobacterium thermophilum]